MNASHAALAPSPDMTVRAHGWDADSNELIARYLPLVRNVVDRIKLTIPSHIEAEELYSVGVTGLIAAVRKYDPEQGSTFPSYAAMRIRGAILDQLRRMDWCPRRARARSRKLKAATIEVEQRLGRPATADEVRAHLGLTEKEYRKWTDEARPVVFIAIDQHVEDDDGHGVDIHELLADDSDKTGREVMEHAELLKLVSMRIAELPDIPKKVLAMYYFEGMRLAEIAAVFGLTESRICQIHKQTILGLQSWITCASRLGFKDPSRIVWS